MDTFAKPYLLAFYENGMDFRKKFWGICTCPKCGFQIVAAVLVFGLVLLWFGDLPLQFKQSSTTPVIENSKLAYNSVENIRKPGYSNFSTEDNIMEQGYNTEQNIKKPGYYYEENTRDIREPGYSTENNSWKPDYSIKKNIQGNKATTDTSIFPLTRSRNTPKQSDSHGKEVVPSLLTYEKKTFLPNFRNPCWYEKHQADGRQEKLSCLPYFFIAGMPKCGTTDLFKKLIEHPLIEKTRKEPHWWTRNRFDGGQIEHLTEYLKLYRRAAERIEDSVELHQFNGTSHVVHTHVIGDASASTLWDMRYWTNKFEYEPLNFTTADIIQQLLPAAKIIVILRNPVDRLYSDYLYFTEVEKSPTVFHQNVVAALTTMQLCMQTFHNRMCAYHNRQKMSKVRLNIGLYHVYIEDWLKVFPRRQMMFLRLEDYTIQRTTQLNKITRFLEIEPYPQGILRHIEQEDISNKRTTSDKQIGEMLPETRILLQNFYQPYNDRLAEILQNDKYRWR